MKRFKDLTLKEKTNIGMSRLRNPDESKDTFAKNNGITVPALRSIEDMISFNKDEAVALRMNKLIKKDILALEQISDINNSFIGAVKNKRTILTKDIDALDKIGNTIMKRAVLVEKMTQERENKEDGKEKEMHISITI